MVENVAFGVTTLSLAGMLLWFMARLPEIQKRKAVRIRIRYEEEDQPRRIIVRRDTPFSR
jgi:hypothetical protein